MKNFSIKSKLSDEESKCKHKISYVLVEKEYGDFVSDNKSNEFLTSINIYKFKAYTLAKLLKIFTNQYHTRNFDSS